MPLPDIPILSDLDGTLIDSRASVVAAFRWWANFSGLSADVVEHIPFGRTSTDAAAVLAPHLDPVREGALLDSRQIANAQGVVALPGAAEILSRLSRLAIVTSAPKALAEARLKAAGLPSPRVLVTPECWRRGKPHPEPYLTAAALLGVEAAECVVLEDSPSGVRSGRRAGMHVIGVLTSYRQEQLAGAIAYVNSPAELPGALVEMGHVY